MHRRAVVLVSILSLLSFGSAASGRSSTCTSARIELPERISVERPVQRVDVPLTRTCGASYVAAVLSGVAGVDDVLIFQPARTGAVQRLSVPDWKYGPGRYSLRNGTVHGGTAVRVAPDTTTVKLGSYLGIGITRATDRIVVRVSARQYDPAADRMVARPGVIGLRQRVSGAPRWTTRAYVRTNPRGDGVFTLPLSTRRPYQAWFGPTESGWGASSLVVVG